MGNNPTGQEGVGHLEACAPFGIHVINLVRVLSALKVHHHVQSA